ncbi:Acetylcholine receptor-like protein cup-4 [Trichinella murrelli]|uniref:Acetylcholine receptor-like protein cup-4 n=2 Tax=Trichinella murrelli TaxID=144512 RepID=A0A0V0TQ50_9BILA|nr:Acetylcholine receptor-like protein cup-4 [Trichinella murrelli]
MRQRESNPMSSARQAINMSIAKPQLRNLNGMFMRKVIISGVAFSLGLGFTIWHLICIPRHNRQLEYMKNADIYKMVEHMCSKNLLQSCPQNLADRLKEAGKLMEMADRMLITNENITDLLPYQEILNGLERSLLETYNHHHRPVKDENQGLIVLFFAVIQHIEEVNEEHQTMTVHGFQYLLWNDEYLSWNPEQFNGVSRLLMHSWHIWKPDLILYNAAGQADDSIRYTFYQHSWVESNGRVEHFPMFRYKASCKFDFTDYPYDVQSCPVILGSWNYNLKELDIRPLDRKPMLNLFWEDEKVIVSGWKVIDVHMNVSFWNAMTDQERSQWPPEEEHALHFPLIYIWIKMERYAPHFTISVLLPALVTSFITVVTFCMASFNKAVVLLAFNLLLQTVLAEDMLFQLPSSSASIPRIVKYFAFNLTATVFAMMSLVVIETVRHDGHGVNHCRILETLWSRFSFRRSTSSGATVGVETTEDPSSTDTSALNKENSRPRSTWAWRVLSPNSDTLNLIKISLAIALTTLYLIMMIAYLR